MAVVVRYLVSPMRSVDEEVFTRNATGTLVL